MFLVRAGPTPVPVCSRNMNPLELVKVNAADPEFLGTVSLSLKKASSCPPLYIGRRAMLRLGNSPFHRSLHVYVRCNDFK